MSDGASATPWLTVVTVVKDAPDDFAATVASLRVQDLEAVEFLVVDSSSEAEPVRDALADLEHQYIWTPPRGIYPAMNLALQMASGDYVYFANAGDLLHDRFVLGQVRAQLADRDVVWAFGEVEVVQRDGSRVVTPRWDYAQEKASLFSRGHFAPHQGTFARRTALLAQGGFDPSYTIVADYAAFLKLSQVADPVHLEPVIATFVEGGVSTVRWQESLRQFHRARKSILAPTGWDAARELGGTARQAVAMGLYRGIWSKVARR